MAKASTKKRKVIVESVGEAHITASFNNIIISLTNKKGDAPDQLNNPSNLIAVDNEDGVFLVADSGNHRIMKFRRGSAQGEIVAGILFF